VSRIEFIPALKHTTIIGFGHKARQGKDEAVRALEAFGAGRVRRFAFADALYAYCRIQHGMRVKDAVLLQDVGLARRQQDPDVWIRACLDAIAAWDADAHSPQVAVIPDVRFENEAATVQAAGGHLIRVRRWLAGHAFVASDRPANHPSEIELNEFPWPNTIENDSGDLLGFTLAVQSLAATLVPTVFSRQPCACGK
jgi:hypothetical protein